MKRGRFEEVWGVGGGRERSTLRGGGGIEVSAFFACAMVCALRPCTRWVERTVGVGVLSAPAGFQTSNPRLGFQRGTRNAQDPPKSTGMVCTWAADTPLRASSTSSSVYSFLILLFFARCQGAPRGGQAYIRSAVSRTCLDERLLVLTFSSPGHRACTPRDVTRARVSTFYGIAWLAVFSIPTIETLEIFPDRSYRLHGVVHCKLEMRG